MNPEEIIEGNKLIAEFECYILHNDDPEYGEVFYHKGDKFKINRVPVIQLDYHKSWDWIMPVVEKIESIGYDFQIVGSHVIVVNSENGYEYDDMSDSKIDAVWQAVVQFIKWHNQQK